MHSESDLLCKTNNTYATNSGAYVLYGLCFFIECMQYLAREVFTTNQLSVTNSQARTAQCTLIGLCRDLRGVAYALSTKNSYLMLFDWFYPDNFEVLHRAMLVPLQLL